MNQLTLAGDEFERHRKPTRREWYPAGTVLVRYTVSMYLHSLLSVGQSTLGWVDVS